MDRLQRIVLLSALCIAASTPSAQFGGFFSSSKNEKEVAITKNGVNKEAGTKGKLEAHFGDSIFSLGGNLKQEYVYAANSVMLNDELPDDVGYFKTTLNLSPHFSYGEQKFGHSAIEAQATLRHKSLWGQSGRTTITDDVATSIVDTLSATHKHKATKPLIWLREAWLKLSLNAIVGSESENLHFVQAGTFPFSLGRGISLGSGYGTPKGYLGVYDRVNDFYAPGLLATGSLIKNRLEYDLYYAKFDEKSAEMDDTFNRTKASQVGKKSSPWRGEGQDDNVWAGQFRVYALNHEANEQELKFQPYVMWNDAKDKKVDFESDSRNRLGIAGASLDWEYNNFECGAEAAFNFGHQTVYEWDRNRINLKRAGNGFVYEEYSHINVGAAPAVVTTAHKTVVDADLNLGTSYNGKDIAASDMTNATNRFRPAYKNSYAGWMTVADAAYTFEDHGLKLAVSGGYASGDENPQNQTVDGKYKGFVGLNELYTGGKVTSILMLAQRDIMRPMSVTDSTIVGTDDDPTETTVGGDSTFTDLALVGAGVTWKPNYSFLAEKLSLNPNVMGFWKNHSSLKYDVNSDTVIANSKASKYLGTEINLIADYKLFTDCKFFVQAAAFLPGSYYKDIKGLPLKDDLIAKVPGVPVDQAAKFRIGDDASWYVNLGVDYKF